MIGNIITTIATLLDRRNMSLQNLERCEPFWRKSLLINAIYK